MANPTSIPTAPAPKTCKCPKCMGSGKFQTFSPYTGRVTYTGKCFSCEGKGRVLASKVEGSEAARQRTGLLIYTANIVLEAAAEDNDERAEFYLGRMLEPMFVVGTSNARKVLNYIGAGKWHDNESGRAHSCDPATARGLRTRLIELGRADNAL